jgi:exodeoxyribonuclease VII small subunit
MPGKAPKPPEKFEEAFDRLEAIVAKLEAGDVALEESLDLYAEGMALVGFCSQKLTVAREKIEQLTAEGADSERADRNAK